jgi:transcription-repair coupling factor (superfamily II helicase)
VALPTLIDAVAGLPAFARVLNTIPEPGRRLTIGGLPGSSDAVVLAALVRRLTTRFFVVVTEGVPQAERWLADLQAILDETPVALYPPREGFGEAEPHAEIAGERVETLERVSRGNVRVLLTTARALLERTRLPTTLRGARLEIRQG